jgi:hypothetical protein
MRKTILISSLLIALLVVTTSALAQAGGGYDLTWSTIDGGGTTFSAGGSYSLGGTIGQPDAGVLSGGAYTLNGGLWSGARANYRVYLPLILRSS